MPTKKTASKEKEEKGPVEVIAEEPIQAVVLADSFNRRFEVLCVDKPRVSLELRQGSTHTIRQSSYGRFVILVPATTPWYPSPRLDTGELELVKCIRGFHFLWCARRCHQGLRSVRIAISQNSPKQLLIFPIQYFLPQLITLRQNTHYRIHYIPIRYFPR
jgi:hypothetical protein